MRRVKSSLYEQWKDDQEGGGEEEEEVGREPIRSDAPFAGFSSDNVNGQLRGKMSSGESLYVDPFEEFKYKEKVHDPEVVKQLMDTIKDPQRLARMTHRSWVSKKPRVPVEESEEESEKEEEEKEKVQASSSDIDLVFLVDPCRFLSNPLRRFVKQNNHTKEVELALWSRLFMRPAVRMHQTHVAVLEQMAALGCNFERVQSLVIGNSMGPAACSHQESLDYYRAVGEIACTDHHHVVDKQSILVKIEYFCTDVDKSVSKRSQRLTLHTIYHVVPSATGSNQSSVVASAMCRAIEQYEKHKADIDLKKIDRLMATTTEPMGLTDPTNIPYSLCFRNYYFVS